MRRWSDRVKRVMDATVAAVGLIAFGPVLAVTALLVYARLGTPVLFRQTRPGYLGRPFTLVEFRTMTDARGPDGALLPDGERFTALGRFLRASSLDELPTLLNVLRGDMSLVGPRPLLMEYLSLSSPEQRRRHEVSPGITGWAQVNGRNAMSWERKFELDVWYVDNRSLALDLRIMALTVLRVVRREGISRPGHATSPRFRGSDDRASSHELP
jgi:sugar transferase EpsL